MWSDLAFSNEDTARLLSLAKVELASHQLRAANDDLGSAIRHGSQSYFAEAFQLRAEVGIAFHTPRAALRALADLNQAMQALRTKYPDNFLNEGSEPFKIMPNPDSPTGLKFTWHKIQFLMASAFAIRGIHPAVIHCCDQAQSYYQDPSTAAPIQRLRGIAHLEMEEFQDATIDLGLLSSSRAATAHDQLSYAKSLIGVGDFVRAESLLSTLITDIEETADAHSRHPLQAQYGDILIQRGKVFVGLNKLEEARSDLLTAIDISPNSPWPYLYLTESSLAQSRDDEVGVWLLGMEKTLTQDVKFHNELGDVYLKYGVRELALGAYEVARKLMGKTSLAKWFKCDWQRAAETEMVLKMLGVGIDSDNSLIKEGIRRGMLDNNVVAQIREKFAKQVGSTTGQRN